MLTETAYTYAILAPEPEAKGHVIVLPKQHVATFATLPEPALLDARQTATFVRQLLMARLQPPYLTLDVRPPADPAGHVSLHLVPRALPHTAPDAEAGT